jgi:hypothetical protein
MITPFYMLILVPVMFLQTPGIQFSMALASVPVINVTMMVREAITGTFHWPQIGVTVLVSAATSQRGCSPWASSCGSKTWWSDRSRGSGRFLRERVLKTRAGAARRRDAHDAGAGQVTA